LIQSSVDGPSPHLHFSFTDSHSLCSDFTVNPKPRLGPPGDEVQGQVNEKTFLYHPRVSEDPLGEEVKATDDWKTQIETLKDVGDFLREQLPAIIPEKYSSRDPPILQVNVTCQRDGAGRTSASWKFAFNGRLCLHVDSENVTLTVVHSGGRRMKEKWESDRDVTQFLKKISMGDCKSWLSRFLGFHSPFLAASPASVPPTSQSRNAASKPSAPIPLLVLAGFVLTVLLG
uniref:MHC class I-like antigen recognition-like domain-containing protein n=1 Tax=Catagonus wagneri TaxID=51154 RepID=A0A8C3VHS3_9CETA